MPERPLLFVDIDGVLSIWGFAVDAHPEGRWLNVDGIVHFLSATAGRTLRAIAPMFDCVWCSGWEEKADEHLPAALGLGPWPHLRLDAARGAGHSVRAHWKLGALQAYAGDRRLAWIDDAVDDGVRAWARERAAATLLVETDPAIGLSAVDGERLRAFAGAVSPR